MIHARVSAGLQALGLALACIQVQASDFFVAPGGTALGPGTLSSPYDLGTALSGEVAQPGDTFWLRGGDYSLGHVDTSIHGAPGSPITFRQVSGEKARIDGSVSLFNGNGWLVFRDFELYSSASRVSTQTNVGYNVTDITILPGIGGYMPNLSFINLIVHDQTRHGIYISEGSTNSIIYGCILFNNGWISPDNAEGHGLYAQGLYGTKTLMDNLVFNNSGASMHVYENATGAVLVGVTLDGNVAFGASAIQNVRAYRDWVVGVDSPALYADNIVLVNNMGYRTPGSDTFSETQIGRDSVNRNVVLKNNYMPLGLLMNNWVSATVTGNMFAPRRNSFVISLDQRLTPLNAEWNDNLYVCRPQGNQIMLNDVPCTFSEWQAGTGFDEDSIFVIGQLSGTRVFVRTNLYEPGRANIIVYNWDNLDNVSVDIHSVLPLNTLFEVRNAQDLNAPPVLSGRFSGQPLPLPMTNLTVASPSGPLITPPPTGPTFNVFLLLPLGNNFQIKRVGGSVQVYWPVGAGSDALQSTPSLSAASWTASAISPAMVGDQFMITEPVGPGSKFYRLRGP